MPFMHILFWTSANNIYVKKRMSWKKCIQMIIAIVKSGEITDELLKFLFSKFLCLLFST